MKPRTKYDSERGIVIVLVGLIFWIGLGASPFIQVIRPSLTALSEYVDFAASDQERQP
jgi:NADH:ubiquinone oxidoreductase subunit 4 (subunit M)